MERARRSRFKGFTAVSFHVLSCECPRSAVRCDPRRGAPLVRHLVSCSSFFASKCCHLDLDRLQRGDLCHRFTELSHEICAHRHGSGSENSPAFSGSFQRPQVISVFAPFPHVPGGNVPLEDRGASITLGSSNTKDGWLQGCRSWISSFCCFGLMTTRLKASGLRNRGVGCVIPVPVEVID